MFDRCVPYCTNFRFYSLTHSSFIIACFCCNLQNFPKKFWCGNHWKGVILWFGQDSVITRSYNDSGQYFVVSTPVKINLTTLLHIFCPNRYIKSSQFCDFLEWEHVKKGVTLIKQNFALRKFQKMIFCYFQEHRSQSNDFYNWTQTFAIKVQFMSNKTNIQI